jgi:hypothetical protein
MKEVWKPVKGYENRYEISNKGRVKTKPNNYKGWLKRFNEPIIRKVGVHKKTGLTTIGLSKNGTLKTVSVHKLVAEHFTEQPSNCNLIIHKDGDNTNNTVGNLEWTNPIELRSLKIGPVYCYNWDLTLEKVWDDLSDVIAEHKDFRRGCIINCIRNKAKTYADKIWSDHELTKEEIALKKRELRLVYQYDMSGKLIKVWRNASAADKSSKKYHKQQITRCCRGLTKYHANSLWKFYGGDVEVPKKEEEIYQYNWKMKLVKKYPSFDKIKGFPKGGIQNCLNGKCKTYKGYVWSLKPLDDVEKSEKLSSLNVVHQLDMEGNPIKMWRNIASIKKTFTSLNPSIIKLCCEGKLASYGGHKWKFEKLMR